MTKYVRNTLTGDLAPVNAELEKIQNSLATKFDRIPSSGEANQLRTTTDANSNRIVNLGAPLNPNDAARLKDLTDAVLPTGFLGSTSEIISLESGYSVGDVVGTWGYSQEGDSGGGLWRLTSSTGAAGQSPSDLGAAQLTDAGGRVWEYLSGREVDIRALGAGGASDATNSILTLALNYISGTGKYLTGGSHGISGFFTIPVGDIHLKDIEFIQIDPLSAINTRTLYASGRDNIIFENVKVNIGDEVTAGSLSDNFAGIFILGGTNHRLSDVYITGRGNGQGLMIQNATDFFVENLVVENMQFYNDGATDDSLEGARFQGCSRFHVIAPRVHNLTGDTNNGRGYITRYTRGLAISGCERFSILCPDISEVDQGIDFSGNVGNGNTDFTVEGGVISDCFTWGYKFANSANRGAITSCVAKDCGYSGFVASGGSGTEGSGVLVKDLTFSNCVSINTGSNAEWPANNPSGFLILQGSSDTNTPYGIKFIGCKAIDDQAIASMEYGFRNQVPAREGKLNECINCESVGHITSSYNGAHFPIASGYRSANQTVATSNTTDFIPNIAVSDTSSMLNTSTGVFTIKKAGMYFISARLSFDVNSTGDRTIGIKINGSTAPRSEITVAANTTGITPMHTTLETFLDIGDEVKVYCLQTSGGNLDILSAGSGVSVSLGA